VINRLRENGGKETLLKPGAILPFETLSMNARMDERHAYLLGCLPDCTL